MEFHFLFHDSGKGYIYIFYSKTHIILSFFQIITFLKTESTKMTLMNTYPL